MTTQQTSPHPLNRNVVIADNLELLKALDNETVDLIVTDPPFAKSYTFTGNLKPPLSPEELTLEKRTLANWGITSQAEAEAAGVEWPRNGDAAAGFSDIWKWEEDVHEEWLDTLEEQYQAAAKVIDAARYSHSDGHAAYLSYMAIRLIEMRRVLKPTGLIYLHCDSTANSYLRMVMDAIFGPENFRNEMAWTYGKMSNETKNFAKNHDTILRYSKTDEYTFYPVKKETSEYRNRYKRYLKDNRVLYGSVKTSSDKLIAGRVKKVTKNLGRELTDTDVLFDFNTEFKNQDDVIRLSHIKGNSFERTGYPTQKPVRLAEILILSSSNPSDVVLDPFAGCAYVPVAAERLGRQWIACDINPRAMTVLRRQFNKFHYAVDGQNPDLAMEEGRQGALLADAEIKIIRPSDIPKRTTADPQPAVAMKPRERKFKHPSSYIPKPEMRDFLLRLSEWRCWTCGFANTIEMVPGVFKLDKSSDNFVLDHITPIVQGGDHQITNRAALCPSCNNRKSGRDITLTAFIKENARNGHLRVSSPDQLIDLARARHETSEYYVKYRNR